MANITIDCYSDAAFGSKVSTWTGHYDPAQMDLDYENRFLRSHSIGISAPPVYAGEEQNGLVFPLFFDNSWVAADDSTSSETTVRSQVDAFLALVYSVNSDSHTANYLKVTVGDFIFSGQTESVRVSYSLFNSEGKPLRAQVELAITQTETVASRKAAAGLQSPDLTRSVIVREGDSLPGLSQKYYNTPHYYLELARVNRITNFRSLRIGTRIVIPPLSN
ncbi:MAG: LysM peptidoglycan-binding domain-containing protein [Bacteroidota bacterium]